MSVNLSNTEIPDLQPNCIIRFLSEILTVLLVLANGCRVKTFEKKPPSSLSLIDLSTPFLVRSS